MTGCDPFFCEYVLEAESESEALLTSLRSTRAALEQVLAALRMCESEEDAEPTVAVLAAHEAAREAMAGADEAIAKAEGKR